MGFSLKKKKEKSEEVLELEAKIQDLQEAKKRLEEEVEHYHKLENNKYWSKKVNIKPTNPIRYIAGGKTDKDMVVLDDKVDQFIEWYTENLVKGNYTNVGEFRQPNEMRNLIEKVAVWYELRYPDYEVNKIYYCGTHTDQDSSTEMFVENPYMKEMNNISDFTCLDWDEFYNFDAFVNTLDGNEAMFLLEPRFTDGIAFLNSNHRVHFHIDIHGIIYGADELHWLHNSNIKEGDFLGKTVKEAVDILEKNGIRVNPNCSLYRLAVEVDKWNYLHEEIFNCIMYRLIERGTNRIGARRAFMFALEFGLNIEIPMAYGVDRSDPGLRKFLLEYIKAGGRSDLVCYEGYGSRTIKNERLYTRSVEELLRIHGDNCAQFYTPEEMELQARLAHTIYNRRKTLILEEERRKEEIQEKRLQRRLEKSRRK